MHAISIKHFYYFYFFYYFPVKSEIIDEDYIKMICQPEIIQVERTVYLDECIIELHNIARYLALHELTKDGSAQLRALAHELSELN
jgi:hypothetical protein